MSISAGYHASYHPRIRDWVGKNSKFCSTIASEILPGPKDKDGLADSRIPRNATALALALETVTKKA